MHASQYALHFDLDETPVFDLKFRLNKNLPEDIVVFEIIEVDEKQHCQYHAVARTYDYFIHWNKDPALFRYSAYYEHKVLNFDLMQQATALILNTKNFTAMCKHPDLYKNTWCQISHCALYVNEAQGRLRFTITSNRFLRGMVRYCIFFLIEIGNGDLTLEEFERILTDKKHFIKKKPAPPNDLFLSKVDYPFLEFVDAHQIIRIMKIGLE